ncbi:putative inactive purple acid phosphatase 2 [Acorus gramineus]|uniref:Purple acid phosphatase n=1 Tax=Acorus gramineus TaxID=55184 RepID=A0AAV9BCQ3_ACOGR|nr:putative inactive purple acid phosphatase 2 [Acorus gramineus]
MASSKPYLLLLLLLTISTTTSFSISLSVTPTSLARSGDSVHITWSGLDSPNLLDWIGIYSPPDSPDDDFIGYVFLSKSPNWAAGSGSVDLPLVNLRSDYQFRLFRWSEAEINPKRHDHDQNPLPQTKRRAGVSARVGFDGTGPARAEQVHLAFTDEVDEMRVVFVAGDRSKRFVKYGEGERRLDRTAEAEVKRYERSDMCDAPANKSVGWRDPGFIHDGVMKGLKKGRRYYYKVGSDEKGWSPIYSFMSRDPDSNETIAFLFGDMGASTPYTTFRRTQDESILTIKWILRDIEALGDKAAFVSHIGDISYARGYSWIWDEFFNQIEPIASKVPYHVCIGNHEYDWPLQPWKPSWSYGSYGKDGGGECGVPYSLKFNMPGNSSLPTGTKAPDTRNLYYSFDSGVVHFLYISTETNFLQGSDQYNFIKNDLESVNRLKTPFVIVQGHRPMYTTSYETRDSPLRERLLKSLEPLLVKNNVTLALWGHVHRYERFCPLKNFTCSESGHPVHLVIGMAGQDWQPIWEPRPDHVDIPIYPQPERSMYRGGEFGYTKLIATREKLMLYYVGNHDGEVHDVLEIPANPGVRDGETSTDGLGGSVVESTITWYVKVASVLLLGAFVGYVVGVISRSRRDGAPRSSWAPVKTEEV